MLVVQITQILFDAHAVLVQLGSVAIVHVLDKLPLRVDLPADLAQQLLALLLLGVLRCQFVAVQLTDDRMATDP